MFVKQFPANSQKIRWPDGQIIDNTFGCDVRKLLVFKEQKRRRNFNFRFESIFFFPVSFPIFEIKIQKNKIVNQNRVGKGTDIECLLCAATPILCPFLPWILVNENQAWGQQWVKVVEHYWIPCHQHRYSSIEIFFFEIWTQSILTLTGYTSCCHVRTRFGWQNNSTVPTEIRSIFKYSANDWL